MSDPVGSTAYRQFEHDMADISEPALLRGLDRAKDFTEFFTLPKFRELCQVTPADFGLPDALTAMREACNAQPGHDYSHPAVYLAACAVGWYDMRNKSERELLPIFENAYAQLCRRVMNGEQLEAPVLKALPEAVHVPADPDVARESLAKMRAMLGGGQV